MQETTYFQPQSKKVVITKKHFVVMLFAWWLIIQFFSFVIHPTAHLIYQTIFQQGIMNVYSKNKQNNHNDQQNKKQQENNKINDHKNQNQQNQPKQNKKIKKNKPNDHNNNNDNRNKQKEYKGEQQQFYLINEEDQMYKNQDFKIYFKIKGKGKHLQDIKSKATQKSLKIAMQEYYQIKKKHQN